MKNKELVKAFIEGKTALKGSNTFIKGNVLYSYGEHFPMALRLDNDGDFFFVVNSDKYSHSTSRHQSYLSQIGDKKFMFKSTYELKNLIRQGINDLKTLMAEEIINGSKRYIVAESWSQYLDKLKKSGFK